MALSFKQLAAQRSKSAWSNLRSVPNARSLQKVSAYKVEIVHENKTHVLEVPAGRSILEVALDNKLDLPHDCKLGVCMTCPAKLISGEVDQSGCILSDDVLEKGYALLCVSQPKSDCKFTTITEDELLDLQLVTSQ